MAEQAHLAMLARGVDAWNRWRAPTNPGAADLRDADLTRMKLNGIDFLRTDLRGANLTKTQLQHAHLKDADLTGATMHGTNLEHVNARSAVFDHVDATAANFQVATLRRARFRRATLSGARFHRTYLRDADLDLAVLAGCWLRFAALDGACCAGTDFSGADLRHASLVETDLKGANLTDVHVFGVSAWGVETDAGTRQDLIVGIDKGDHEAPLRTHDLRTAQLLSLMLDAAGVRTVIDSVTSKLVLILGSFAPAEKPVLDALRESLQGHGYVAVEFDFERPSDRDYAETILTLVGMSRFVVADFTNAKEVRAEVAQAHRQYKRVPIIPIAKEGVSLPITMANTFDDRDLAFLVRYGGIDDLKSRVEPSIIEPAERQAARIAEGLSKSEAILLGAASGSAAD